MKQSLFEKRHAEDWQRFATRLEVLERSRRKSESGAGFSREYRQICQHLSLAIDRGYASHLVEHLQQLAMRGHQQLYRHRSQFTAQLLSFVLADFPRLVRAQWRWIALAGLLFFGSLTFMALLVYGYPDLVYSVVSPADVAEMHAMYEPAARRIGQTAERASSTDWLMFGYYVMHNIGIAFQTFASGLFFGVGSLFFLFFNGLMIGAVAGHLTDAGMGATFWPFVVGHSAFELTGITLAGAAGLKLGWALVAPGRLRRGEALRQAAQISVRLIGGVAMFLLIAAFIEAYWSSMSWPPATAKYGVGASLWLLVGAYLTLAGRTPHAPD
ncbi:stage II sporulation protein M [Pseudomonas graminis]|uniref:stage II sporulation protein M n=1 Tax=Pseudomonas graminis TaxID=158627 RepID=UPI00234BA2A8|nr:stage II sporulation protein M [Pseudomonas graminis]MDC6379510.1 stage II sporulation protein M [Pseudomonas graminis]